MLPHIFLTGGYGIRPYGIRIGSIRICSRLHRLKRPISPYFLKLSVISYSDITPCLTLNTFAAVLRRAVEGSQQVMNTCQPSM